MGNLKTPLANGIAVANTSVLEAPTILKPVAILGYPITAGTTTLGTAVVMGVLTAVYGTPGADNSGLGEQINGLQRGYGGKSSQAFLDEAVIAQQNGR